MARTPIYAVNERPQNAPLSLGMLLAYVEGYKGGVLKERYEVVPHLIPNQRALRSEIAKRGPGVLLFSNYVWNTKELLAVSKTVKEALPECLTVHGGPSVPKYDYACEAFMNAHPHVDVAVRSEGEPALVELLDRLVEIPSREEALAGVGNITYRTRSGAGEIVRTADRERAVDISVYPSPYLTGMFDKLGHNWLAGIIETNRGCPYGCTFCDWGSATLQKLRQFPLDRVEAEIDWIGRRKLEVMWIADSNFGIFPRDVEIAKMTEATKKKYGYPRQVAVSYAKNATERVTEIAHIFGRSKLCEVGILALQSTDEKTLATIARANIKTKRYVELRRVFDERKVPVATDLLLGLPGGNYKSFRRDLQFCFDHRCHAKAYRVQVLPNSPMAHRDYRAAHGIKTDADDKIVSTSTFTEEQLRRAEQLYDWYIVLVEFGLLKYLLAHLQHEHEIPALDFIEAFAADFQSQDAYPFPVARKVVEAMGMRGIATRQEISYRAKAVFLAWKEFYAEIASYLAKRHGIERDSALDCVFELQAAVMPSAWNKYPLRLRLKHDVVAYYTHVFDLEREGPARRLADFPPTDFEVQDPLQMRLLPLMFWRLSYGFHKSHFELSSPLSGNLYGASEPPFLFVPEEATLKAVAHNAGLFGTLLVNSIRRSRDAAKNGIRRHVWSA